MKKVAKENAVKAWKKALSHKKEAGVWFEQWLKEKGVEGRISTL